MCLPRLLRFLPLDSTPATDAELALLPSFIYHKDTYHLAGEGYPAAIHELQPEQRDSTSDGNIRVGRQSYATLQEEPLCPICLCEYEDGVDVLRRFSCKHDYHKGMSFSLYLQFLNLTFSIHLVPLLHYITPLLPFPILTYLYRLYR